VICCMEGRMDPLIQILTGCEIYDHIQSMRKQLAAILKFPSKEIPGAADERLLRSTALVRLHRGCKRSSGPSPDLHGYPARPSECPDRKIYGSGQPRLKRPELLGTIASS